MIFEKSRLVDWLLWQLEQEMTGKFIEERIKLDCWLMETTEITDDAYLILPDYNIPA